MQHPPVAMLRDVRSNKLERRLQSRAKQNEHMMTKEGWVELLDVTIPKLKRRRKLRRACEATRLAYVMGLVGSRRDAPLASRAVAALLVDHWCPEDSHAFLQKDAMRHATVSFLQAEMRDPWKKGNIARQLELGVRSALDGVGLEFLETFPDWNRDRHILFPGGAELLREEIGDLASDCRQAQSDSEALVLLEQYVALKKLDTFPEDFIEWGKVQLDSLPETALDGATSKQAAPPSSGPAQSKAKLSSAMEGSRSNCARGGGGSANGGGASDAGRKTQGGRQRSSKQSPPEGKQTNPKQGSNSGSNTAASSSSSSSDSGNNKGSKSRGGDKGSSRDGGGGGGRGKEQRGSRSVPAPVHANGTDGSGVGSDCRRDSSSWTEACSFESEGEEVNEEADPRFVKRLKTSGSNAMVRVEGDAKAGRKAAAATRDKIKSRAGVDSVTIRTVRPSVREGKPAMAPTKLSASKLTVNSRALRGPATYRMGDTDEAIPSGAGRRLLQIIHAISRDGGGVSGYFDRIPEVIASLRKLALFDLRQSKLAPETPECEWFLRNTFANALCTTGRSEGYEFLPLVKYVLQDTYEGPETMSMQKASNVLSTVCAETKLIEAQFPRFSFLKLRARVIFVIQKG